MSDKRSAAQTPSRIVPTRASADDPGHGEAGRTRSSRRTLLTVTAVMSAALILAGAVALYVAFGRSLLSRSASDATASFVGSETCAGCHHAQAELWQNSQHKHAMAHATEQTVLGDFNDAEFSYYGVRSRFFRKDGKFFVATDGPDGKLAPFEVKYTFGVEPLQQYLVEFPDGRLQALALAWDSRPKEQGGQRWFHLYPNEDIRHDDILHWTKLNQNWNFMCAECHSTGVRKNYDAAADRYATTWAEISVGCEACHGQGSRHVAWAHEQQSWWPFGKRDDAKKGLSVDFDERRDAAWPVDPGSGQPRRNFTPAQLRKEVETCGLCHARRGAFSEAWIPGRWLSDTHAVSGINRGLYHPDGQMLDEVYNYGSFKQSKMFAAGVTCSDCHDPHSAKLRAAGDAVCTQCHAPERYAAASHHHHEKVSAPPGCVACHMPATTYMVVDRRHDHGFRVPRPDVSARLGTPNACNDCHTDKPPQWAAAAIETWFGPNRKGFQTYPDAFHSAWNDRADAAALLAVLAGNPGTAPIVRASALAELAPHVSPANIKLARSGLASSDPMVRLGALDMLANLPPAQLWPLVSPLLSDSNRGVRIRAAALLAGVPTANQPPADRETFERAAGEFIAAQRLNADRPEARSTLGNFFARRGLAQDAEDEFRAALRLSPQYAPAAINLADLYRQLRRDGDGEAVLKAAIAASPRDAGLHHALGLALTRLTRREEALDELRRAAELQPERARYAYVYAVALHSAGRQVEAIAALKDILNRHPDDRDALRALIGYSRDAGDLTGALGYAERLAKLLPDDINLTALIATLRRQAGRPAPQ